ncbi:NAD-dependent succinate-semialdehyde dehydrogenase [Williamsia soli]|uniref:NAD-dependent succinate-semialdehyde dehydrogenase n=1 Tax=Williamsia soli TaxID=364929 RepID=UPI001A9DFE6B|nr:NAD-dependent succinate-semialdehyde dehydrogenase [Williamsia soli]
MTDTSTDPIAQYRDLLATVPTGLWINGDSVAASSTETFSVDDPATGTSLLHIADATPDDANTALESALAVADEWADTAPRARSEILRGTFELIREHADDMAMIMTLEMGKALPDSVAEINYGGEFLRWFAEEAVRVAGRFTKSPGGTGRIMVTHAPVGVAFAITPWNFPLAMGTRKIGPALAAGCTIIVKPAHETPLTMLYLAKLFGEAGLPAGVLSVLPTSKSSEVSTPLIADPRVRKISFTGSTPVGRTLIGQAAENVQRTSMELGGNAPFLVFDDADVDKAVEGAFAAKTRNGGEACTAANRFLVQEGVAEEFTAALTEKMKAMVLGRGYDSDTTLGPMVSVKQQTSIAKAVSKAVADGARVRLGADPADDAGCFYPATVLDQVPSDAEIVCNEIFGPVAVISTFASEDEAIAAANATEYGLAAYLYTQDLDRALRVADKIESGMVGINRGVISDVAAPFGGVKQSGIGREGGSEGIYEYLTTKYIALT